jgi:DNA-binding XRE family transcriptional regulator
MKHKPDFIDREIGRRLRVARIAADIRQYRAAKVVGVTYQQMRKYEVGNNRVSAVIVAFRPRPSLALCLALALGRRAECGQVRQEAVLGNR